jgi:hypothetical protein
MNFFAFAQLVVQASGPSNVGGSASHAKPVPDAKAPTTDASGRVKMLPFLEASSSESHKPSHHEPPHLLCSVTRMCYVRLLIRLILLSRLMQRLRSSKLRLVLKVSPRYYFVIHFVSAEIY